MNRYTPHSPVFCLLLMVTSVGWDLSLASAGWLSDDTADELQVAVAKKGAGKQVVISQRAKEWFMLIDVTPENTVILKQEKDHDRYVVDESETHDRPMTPDEVDAAITDYVNSVKARVQKK
ncbi:MAG: hypothetical protein HP496_08405 [Nitrospira sp.]|nr:hypothetical protein [Nitrospira sp.]